MGLFDFFKQENGPCSSCHHKIGDECQRFYEKKYDRVNGTVYIYDSCAKARSSSGFCGHKGKYWEVRDRGPRICEYENPRNQPEPDIPGNH